MVELTKLEHELNQLEVRVFRHTKTNNMIDFMVVKEIERGQTDLDEIAGKFRLGKDRLLNSLTASLFSVNGDNINLA